MTLGGSLETSSVSSFFPNQPRDPKEPNDPQPETRLAARSTKRSFAGSANVPRPERGFAARPNLIKVMLSLKDRPLRATASASESLTRHDSAALSKKRADYGVFLPCYGLSVPDNSGLLWNSPAAGNRAPARARIRVASSQEQIWAFGPKLRLSSARRRNSRPRDGG